jgi:hypothetical protein
MSKSCPDPEPKNKRNYVEPHELQKLVRVYRKPSGRTAEVRQRRRLAALGKLVLVWDKIARGINSRFKFARGASAIDDYVQDCQVDLLLHALPNADAQSLSLFGYFSKVCQNVGRAQAKTATTEAANFVAYARTLDRVDTLDN